MSGTFTLLKQQEQEKKHARSPGRMCCGCCLVSMVLLLIYLSIGAALYFDIGASGKYQTWAMLNPWNPLSFMMLPVLGFVDSLVIGQTWEQAKWQLTQGDNFTAAGMLWLTGFNETKIALSKPQARTSHFGEHPLIHRNLPDVKRSRNIFLLALSDEEVGGDGRHEAFRQAFIDVILTPQARGRMHDDVTAKLLGQLEADYVELHSGGDRDNFFHNMTTGLPKFCVRFLNYVLFAIDPENEEMQAKLLPWFSRKQSISYYAWPMGYVMSLLYGDELEVVADIYEQSPPLLDFMPQEKYKDMTARELAMLSTAIMRIVGVEGLQKVLQIVLGARKIAGQHVYPQSRFEPTIDAREVWDTLDLRNKTQLRHYVMECTRLDTPVPVVHRVATEDMEVYIDGLPYTFPAGTKLAVSLALAHVDPDQWGPTAYEFNLHRPGLQENYLAFNSYSTNGRRECPARELVMDATVAIVQRLGRVRRHHTTK